MAFHSRRVSRDRAVCQRILQLCDGKLRMAPYSRTLFPPELARYAADNFMEKAGASDWCFAETVDLTQWLNKAEELVLFCWNRAYPFDLGFPSSRLQTNWERIYTEDFSGYSHERITMEVYRRCGKNG